MKAMLLRFDAPLLSFGGPAVDHNGVVQRYPALSMLTGLFANALGWDYRRSEQLDRLQERLRFAVRIDRQGEQIVDYQTVDLGTDWMDPERAGWTTRGHIAERGGASSDGTHQRWRHYRADSVQTLCVSVIGDEQPTVDDLAAALAAPARPLFLGRKACLPASPLLLSVRDDVSSLLATLEAEPRPLRADPGPLPAAWWELEQSGARPTRNFVVHDERDWRTRVHVGRRIMVEGHVNPPEVTHE